MLTKNDVIAFLATAQPDEAKRFYSEVLGVRLVEDTPFALVFDANGTMLRIQKVQAVTPVGYTVLGWQVVDMVATVEELRQRGVVFERYRDLGQDEQGIWISPAGAKIAWFRDPDGNTLSLTEFHEA